MNNLDSNLKTLWQRGNGKANIDRKHKVLLKKYHKQAGAPEKLGAAKAKAMEWALNSNSRPSQYSYVRVGKKLKSTAPPPRQLGYAPPTQAVDLVLLAAMRQQMNAARRNKNAAANAEKKRREAEAEAVYVLRVMMAYRQMLFNHYLRQHYLAHQKKLWQQNRAEAKPATFGRRLGMWRG